MHHKLIIRGIKGIISGGISVHDFAVASEMDEFSSKELLQIFLQNGIGILNESTVEFEDTDRINASVFAIRNGAMIEDVSEFLTWQNFEELVSRILDQNGFHVQRNLILTKPRMEIDVVGVKLGISILIDCKHWKSMTQSALNEIVNKQINRVKKYVEKTADMQLSSFLDEFYGNLDKMKTIEK